MITLQRLKEVLSFNPDTGEFLWKMRTAHRIKIGDIAGYIANRGIKLQYVEIRIDNKLYLGHRLAWLYHYGDWPEKHIDHIDHNGLNNKISNLRDVSCRENSMNHRLHKNNSSGVNGVYWNTRLNKWVVEIILNRKKKYLGCFDDLSEAAEARKVADIEYGFHENHGYNL